MNNAASNSGLINVPQAEHLAAVILPQHLRSPELENTRSLPPRPARRARLDLISYNPLLLPPPPLPPPTSEKKVIPVIKPSSSGARSPYV